MIPAAAILFAAVVAVGVAERSRQAHALLTLETTFPEQAGCSQVGIGARVGVALAGEEAGGFLAVFVVLVALIPFVAAVVGVGVGFAMLVPALVMVNDLQKAVAELA